MVAVMVIDGGGCCCVPWWLTSDRERRGRWVMREVRLRQENGGFGRAPASYAMVVVVTASMEMVVAVPEIASRRGREWQRDMRGRDGRERQRHRGEMGRERERA